MKDFLKKFGSRKFLMALVSVVSGVLTIANCDDNLIQLICSLTMIIIPVIVYIITEGVIDYTGVGLALQDVLEAINKYIDIDKIVDEENNEENNIDEYQEEPLENSKDNKDNIVS